MTERFTLLTPRRLLYTGLWFVVLLGAILVPMPFFTVSPGTPVELDELIVVEGQPTTPLRGEAALLAVTLRRPSVVEVVLARFDDRDDLVPQERYLRQGTEDEDYFAQQAKVFASSIDVAAAVALDAAGFDVRIRSSPLVLEVLANGPSAGLLRAGDLVVQVNGVEVATADDLVQQAQQLEAGDVATLVVERRGELVEVEVTAGQAPRMARPGLGVTVDTTPRDVALPFDVHLADGVSIGGPSAGLMFAVTIYDLVSDEDLLDGRLVTGTGTIEVDGSVGRIGSIRQKVTAAIDAGYDVFLAPTSQAVEAREAAGDDIVVIGIDRFADALAALRERPVEG